MNTNLLKMVIVAVLGLGIAASPAMARSYRHHKHYHHHHHHGRYYHGPRVSVGFYSAPYYRSYYRPYYRPYYYSAPVVVTAPVVQPRPVYVANSYSSAAGVQRELARRGYYNGAIDGVVGPQTRAAIRTYQVDRALPVTGRIDTPLLRSLRLI